MHGLLAGVLFGVAAVAFTALGVWLWREAVGRRRRADVRQRCAAWARGQRADSHADLRRYLRRMMRRMRRR